MSGLFCCLFGRALTGNLGLFLRSSFSLFGRTLAGRFLGGLFSLRQNDLLLQNEAGAGGDVELNVVLAVEELGGVGLNLYVAEALTNLQN